jgi:hypothetical protein
VIFIVRSEGAIGEQGEVRVLRGEGGFSTNPFLLPENK